MPSIFTDDDNETERLASLALVLPLALVSFVIVSGCWTIFAAAGPHLRSSLGLSSLELGFLLAMPMAFGALLAVPAGLIADRLGARRVMVGCLLGLAVSMVVLLLAKSWSGYLLAAAGLGLAGGFYGAGLQFVTSHTPRRHAGLVLGLFGAGVTGAGFNYYLVPLILQAFSWDAVPTAYLIVLLLVAALLVLLTDNPTVAAPTTSPGLPQVSGTLGLRKTWRLCFYFGVVAGSFFSLALWLPDFISLHFVLTMETGARLAMWFVIPGALAQISGGALSDRYGDSPVILRSLAVSLFALFVLSYPPMTLAIQGVTSVIELELALPLVAEGFFIVLLGMGLGSAMGGLQRMVITARPGSVALFAGMLLSSACLIAFLLPVLFGALIDWTGVRTAMFMILFLLLAGSGLMYARDHRNEERQALLLKGV
ncbi:MFS transporter [Marinobacter sp. CHS3-4]|uniref:MFS transporter n=1 Tax=Marinobacter sp. CHS3-4 TaxID=3045174 RepID=UPI0024B51DFD|nr:MFS transporter [Marinobacter sp. CHS3-4]MDI9244142.1 MFS transporter [Marinobacter sp. CHS3-4]